MKIRKIVALCLSLLAGVCAGCSDYDADFDPVRKHSEGDIILRIGTGTRTRTQLKGSYNLNHVGQVYAILYEGTGDGATYVCHKDLNWSPKDSLDHDEGVVQEKVYELEVPPTLKSGSECTLLCVGLDDASGVTYSLKLDTDNSPSFCAEGRLLSDAKAILAENQSMTKAELFAGWETFTYQRKDTTAVEVELTRRVSGAYAYLKDIPVKIDGKEVKSIQLVLGNLPNTQIGLTRKERTADDMLPDDFGSVATTDESAKILDKLTLEYIAEANTAINLYDIKEDYTDKLNLRSNTLLLSAYLLPMKAGTESTLAIELLDGSGGLIKSFPAQWNNVPATAGTVTEYPIYPNYVYHVGTRSADSDRPASLAGDRIELAVQQWTELTIETEFPKVPLEATIDYDKNPLSYIYDCINTYDTLTVMPSLLQRSWTLTLAAEDDGGDVDYTRSCDWIYFVNPKDGSYTQTITSSDYTYGTSKDSEVVIRLNDYVVKRNYDPATTAGQMAINGDLRRARIVITTDGSLSSSYCSIRQYNAITVNVTYDGKAKDPCGFSRYNYGVVRDGNGAITEDGDGYQGKWGIQDKVYGLVYRDNTSSNYYDGYQAHENINSSITDPTSGYWGTTGDISSQPIIRYSWTESWVWNGIEREQSQNYWYLPSWYELAIFFRDIASQSAVNTNVKINHWYWSSTAKYLSKHSSSLNSYYSYGQMLGDDGKPVKMNDTDSFEARTWRTETGYARRARHFDDYDATIK